MRFAPLYCQDNGSPNKPVNILLSLEFIKHLYDYTDEQLLEQYYFNYQIAYALGQRNLGELYICERTIYDFRQRLYEYTIQHPEEEDLICQQFQELLDHFLAITKIKTAEQRMDSSAIMPNIKRAGRLALAFDVLKQGVAACPQELLPEDIGGLFLNETLNEFYFRFGLDFRESNSQGQKLFLQLQDLFRPGLEVLTTGAKRTSVLKFNFQQLKSLVPA